MTEQRLRDLMHDTVADVVPPNAVDLAWRRAEKTRRRNRVVAVVGAAAAVALVAATIALVDRPGIGPGPGPSTESPRPTPSAAAARPDTRIDGIPVWWSPNATEEQDLPALQAGRSDLPRVIDLTGDAPDAADHPLGRAL